MGDLDLLISAGSNSVGVMDEFVGYEDVVEVLAKGPTRATVRLRNGLHVDVRVAAPESFGAALHYFTGSKAHNIALRRLAMAKRMKLNEYGAFRDGRRVAGRSEREVFAAVGLPFIPPELREDRGEIDAARRRRLPALVELGDIRGDLHCHTNASDGRDTVAAMARAAAARGYEYVSVNDHTKRVGIAHGLDARRLRQQLFDTPRAFVPALPWDLLPPPLLLPKT